MPVLDITPDEYFLRPEISNSCLRCYMTEGPLVCYHSYIKRDISSPTSEAKEFGSAFHAAVADPDSFLDYYATIPTIIQDDAAADAVRAGLSATNSKAVFEIGAEIDRRKPAHRQYVDLLREQATIRGMDYVAESDFERIQAMIACIHQHSAASEYVSLSAPHNTEVAYVSRDRKYDIGIKALVDLDLGEVIVDYKTTKETTPQGFQREIRKNYKYQAEWYLRVTGAKKMVFIAISKKPPHECFVFTLTREELNDRNNMLATDVMGELYSVAHANDVALSTLEQSISLDQWHSNGHGVEMSAIERLAI